MAATPPAQDATVSHGTGNLSPKVRVEGAAKDVGEHLVCSPIWGRKTRPLQKKPLLGKRSGFVYWEILALDGSLWCYQQKGEITLCTKYRFFLRQKEESFVLCIPRKVDWENGSRDTVFRRYL